jgi:lipopolysaccharide export system protein LptA
MLSKTLLRSIVGLLCLCTLQAQMTPSAPVQNFRLPRFGENGYTQWVLQGGKGIYDSAEQIRIEEMALRVYSGDERMALEMTMDSPEATLLTAENRAVSDGPITIVGANFKVSGVGWTWNGLTKEIEVKFDVVVEFTQGMAGMLTGAVAPEGTAVERTEIHSRSLLLHTTAEAYRFTFTDSVHAASGEMDLKSEVLVAVADAPKGKEGDGSTVGGGTIDSIRQLIATDQVEIQQGGHVLKAGHAEFRLREQAAEFTGNPEILAASGAYLSGATIRSQEGLVFVTGNADDGRAQLIVSQAQGLGILGAQIESAETIVLADSITMRELETGNQFLFDGSVEVMSGLMIMYSNQLTLFADQPVKGVTTAAPGLVADDAEVLKVGQVRRVLAQGAVRIEQANKVATSDKAIFYPQEKRAELFGSPRVTDGEVIITGDRMELKPGIAVVYSDTDKRVKVVLPEIADLGYEDRQALTLQPNQSQQAPQTPQTQQAPGSETVVESKTLRMIEETDKTLFRFTESVSVSGTNVHALCERLDVTAVAVQVAETKESQLEVQTIEAFDNVVFKQTGRVATGDKATIRPIEGKVVLEGNAVVTDEMGKVSGHRMILLQGQRRAIVEGDRSTGKRATMTLPEIKPRSK